jgi:hypothetical protein
VEDYSYVFYPTNIEGKTQSKQALFGRVAGVCVLILFFAKRLVGFIAVIYENYYKRKNIQGYMK